MEANLLTNNRNVCNWTGGRPGDENEFTSLDKLRIHFVAISSGKSDWRKNRDPFGSALIEIVRHERMAETPHKYKTSH